MDREKKATRQQARPPQGNRAKKPYSKPVLRRLGTVRELTQTAPSKFTK